MNEAESIEHDDDCDCERCDELRDTDLYEETWWEDDP
jgi:hypothetical protein